MLPEVDDNPVAGDQLYEVAPDAVRLIVADAHLAGAEGEITTEGVALTVMVLDPVRSADSDEQFASTNDAIV